MCVGGGGVVGGRGPAGGGSFLRVWGLGVCGWGGGRGVGVRGGGNWGEG